jgi:S1-C subfamily serine protease
MLDAKLIGTDPNTDVAVLQVKEKNLPYMTFGNSDDLYLGDWVLAVGNPFNLYSTVTAGIVSAKGRDMGIIGSNSRDPFGRVDVERMQNAIESFIQTDAAVNPGNSGGALVNLKGELVGINTAIASMTGSYSGYSFAIPAVIAKKVVDDLIEFGSVQRAVMGVTIQTVNAELADKEKLDVTQGVYVSDLIEDGGAFKAGIEIGDVITAINDKPVNSSPELQEQISRFRPGDEIRVEIDRNGNRKVYDVELSAQDPDARRVGTAEFWAYVGADLEKLGEKELERYDLTSGVRVNKLHDGKFKDSGMPEGYIITRINRATVRDVDDVKNYIEQVEGGVFIEGVLPNGRYEFYTFRK